ncbi:MAG TPA: ATP-binding protein [Bryobacteraceae bacterium]|nr:ATP-binding protein [Bryobacteraceae bacterium]
MSRIRLTINSDLRDVVLIGLAVNKICEHLRMDPVESYQVELCAVEAVTNSIRHAYNNESGNEVSVTLAVRDGRLVLEIADTGLAMQPEAQNRLAHGSGVFEFDPNDETSLPEGGMGLQIMHEVMDEVSYKSEGQVNSLQLIRLIRAVQSCGPGNSFGRSRTLRSAERSSSRSERNG